MAKQGLTYFQVSTDRFYESAIKRLKKHFGCEGYAVYAYVENELVRNKGCYLVLDDDTIFDIADYWALDEARVSEIINYCASVGIFDKSKLEASGVLTSEALQERYIAICRHAHKAINIPAEIALIESAAAPVEAAPTTPAPLTDENNFAKFREISRKTRNETDKRKEKENISPSIPLREEEDVKTLVTAMVHRLSATAPATPPATATPDKAEKRNEQGLIAQLTDWHVPLNQIKQICELTRYGEIGNPVWLLFDEIRKSRGRITMPGLFIISRLTPKNQITA